MYDNTKPNLHIRNDMVAVYEEKGKAEIV